MSGRDKGTRFVVVRANMDQPEYEYRIDGNVVTFFDEYGVDLVSNRLELALTQVRAFMDIGLTTSKTRLQASLTAALLGLFAFWQSRQLIADQLRIDADAKPMPAQN